MGLPFLKQALHASLALFLVACASPSSIEIQQTTSTASQTPNLPLATSTIFVAENEIYAISIAQIQISSPGPKSRLTSPIDLEAQLYPGAAGKARIELFAADGRLLARKTILFTDDLNRANQLQTSIDFEIASSSASVLILSTEDQYGRLQALNSVELILLPEGDQVIAPTAEDTDSLQILSPQASAQVSGGTMTITGQARSRPGRALNVQLITREGRVLTFGEVYPHFEQGSQWGEFEIQLNYKVKEATWVQIAITENDPLIPRPIRFSGIEVLLVP